MSVKFAFYLIFIFLLLRLFLLFTIVEIVVYANVLHHSGIMVSLSWCFA